MHAANQLQRAIAQNTPYRPGWSLCAAGSLVDVSEALLCRCPEIFKFIKSRVPIWHQLRCSKCIVSGNIVQQHVPELDSAWLPSACSCWESTCVHQDSASESPLVWGMPLASSPCASSLSTSACNASCHWTNRAEPSQGLLGGDRVWQPSPDVGLT